MAWRFTRKREFKFPGREAGPLNHHNDKVDSDQSVLRKELSLSEGSRFTVFVHV